MIHHSSQVTMCILCDYQCKTSFFTDSKIRFYTVFLTNEVNCFCSPVLQPHLIIFVWDDIPLFTISAHYLQVRVWTINCAALAAPTDLHTRWKNLQDSSVCVGVGTLSYRYFCHHYCSAGSYRSGAGGNPHFSVICPGWQHESVSINVCTCTVHCRENLIMTR